jgi:hypothetical protein
MNLSMIKNLLKDDVKKVEKENLDKEDYYLEREVEKMKKNWNIIGFIEKLESEETLFKKNLADEQKYKTDFDIKNIKNTKDIKNIKNLKGILFS